MIIQFLGDAVVLTIGQTDWPLVNVKDTEALQRIRDRGYVEITPRARYIIPAAAAAKFVRAFKALEAALPPPEPEEEETVGPDDPS